MFQTVASEALATPEEFLNTPIPRPNSQEVGLGWRSENCISNKMPEDAAAACLGTLIRVVLF